jgi:ABC-type glycerol-3-phosphate transport system permease component
MSPMRKKKLFINILCYFLLIVPLAFFSLPLLTALASSFKPGEEIFVDKGLIPKNPTLDNYYHIIKNFNFFGYFKNSVIISATATFGCVMIGSLAGYSISRFRGGAFNVFKLMTYVLQMIPMGLVFLPMYIVVRTLGLYDTQASVMFLYIGLNLCLNIWIMKGFFDTIPYEIEESAFMDGCGQYRSFLKIVLPLAGPGIACCSILTFMSTYNEMALASIFLKNPDIQPITLGMQQFSQQFTAASSWGYIYAGAVLTTLPAVIVVFLAQKYIIAGLSGAGSLKG